MPVAILDFGTNTFNLLIAEKKGKSFHTLYSGKEAVKLGKGGINKRIISEEAMERGFKAISRHMFTINKFAANEIHAYATSAIRNASNGVFLVEEIKKRFGFTTHIIDGEREASLIFDGISASVDFGNNNAMILDIGGGSNEFIICNAAGILWKHSFELGMARIIEKFTLSDPITTEEIKSIQTYYASELNLLGEKAKYYHPEVLIGASGTFDTLAAITKHRFSIKTIPNSTSMQIDLEHFREIHRLLINSTAIERLQMHGMEPLRVEMIVPAMIFINFVITNFGMKSITQSEYALKEGVMVNLIK